MTVPASDILPAYAKVEQNRVLNKTRGLLKWSLGTAIVSYLFFSLFEVYLC